MTWKVNNIVTLTFFETPRFIAVREEYFDDEHYRSLQNQLMVNPARGVVIPGCGGLRKIRVADPRRGKGTRGGLRVIYLHIIEAEAIVFFAVYDKDEMSDLSAADKRVAALLAEEARKEIIAGFRMPGRE